MSNSLWMVDAHCHWSDERLFAETDKALPQMIAKNVLGFQLGGVDPSEWERQDDLAKRFPGRIWRVFGLHPYFVAMHDPVDLEEAWTELQARASDCEALGEMGLDFRTHLLDHGKSIQIEYFQRQLALAKQLKKAAVLHIVRAHEEALHELKALPVKGMVHAFNSNAKVAKRYLDLGLYLSIGGKLLNEKNEDLADAVLQTPLEKLLIESDCPDQAPPGRDQHDSSTVWTIAERISVLKSLPLKEVVEQTRKNLFALNEREFRP